MVEGVAVEWRQGTGERRWADRINTQVSRLRGDMMFVLKYLDRGMATGERDRAGRGPWGLNISVV